MFQTKVVQIDKTQFCSVIFFSDIFPFMI